MIATDLRHAMRTLRRSPGFATAAILCLALGTGATATVFAVVNALLFRPLPVAHPDNLVMIASLSSGVGLPGDMAYLNYLDIRSLRTVVSDAAAWNFDGVSVRIGEETNLRQVTAVSDNYWAMLGVRPILGRAFTPQEALQRSPLAVISYRCWQRDFNGAPNVLGRSMIIDGNPFTIVGVAPREFLGTQPIVVSDAWVPASVHEPDLLQRRAGGGWKVIGRLREGVDLAAARSALDVLASQLQHQYPVENEGERFVIERELRARPDIAVAGVLPRAAAVFIALTTLVLLIACANVASLMLARVSGRRTELAVRSALGASRARIIQQLLTESVVIAVCGGVVGTLLALGAARWLSAIKFSTNEPIEFGVSLDWRVLAMTAGAVLLASILSGAGPSLRSSDPQLSDALRAGARGTGGITRQRFRAGLVTAQIAVSFVLLIAAGLFLRSVQHARLLDLGFRQDHAFMASTDVTLARYDSIRGKAFYRSLLARAADLPGVRGAALASTIPLGTSHNDGDVYADLPTLAAERGHTHVEMVSVTPGYFDVMGIGVQEGRDFTTHDDTASSVVIVNAAMAARLWPGADAVGQRMRLRADGPEVTVVGVARTVMSMFLGESPRPILYVPFARRYRAQMALQLATTGDPGQLAAPVRDLVASLDPNLPPFAMKTMREHLDGGIAFTPIRLAATLATAIGLLGLIQALIGLYGVVAYSVAQRGHEIGIRMAIGATSGAILRGVLREGMILTGAGLAIGLVLSLGVTSVLRSLLIGVSARDPATFAGLALVLALVTLAACWIPAARAASVPPAGAMRN